MCRSTFHIAKQYFIAEGNFTNPARDLFRWKRLWLYHNQSLFLAGAQGLEPWAYGFGDRRSTNWAIPLYIKRRKGLVLDGGPSGIRTTEVVDNRFTVCPLWPLGNTPPLWSWWRESNPQPADYKSAALPLSHTSNLNIGIISNKKEFVNTFLKYF